MKFVSRAALTLAAAGLAPFPSALAADYDPPIFVEEAAEYVPVEIGSGWYLRGDVGYAFSSSIGQVDYETFDGAVYEPASFSSQDLEENITWGGGVGYRFTDFFRMDATVDGFRADFSGTTTSDEPCLADPVDDTTCRSENGSEVSAISVMANAYVDLGTYVGITPYLGAGAGYTFLSWGDLNDTTYCVDDVALCASDAAVGGTSRGGSDEWRLTYALMAGAAYDLTPNFKLDLGYKYRRIEGGDMFGWDSPQTAGNGSHGDIDQHEVKLGLRYEIW